MIENLQRAAVTVEVEAEEIQETIDARVFSSVLVSTKIQQPEESWYTKDPHARLVELMKSAPINALLQASESLATKANITHQEALQQIIMSFKEVDYLWSQVLLKEGLAHLSSQYH